MVIQNTHSNARNDATSAQTVNNEMQHISNETDIGINVNWKILKNDVAWILLFVAVYIIFRGGTRIMVLTAFIGINTGCLSFIMLDLFLRFLKVKTQTFAFEDNVIKGIYQLREWFIVILAWIYMIIRIFLFDTGQENALMLFYITFFLGFHYLETNNVGLKK